MHRLKTLTVLTCSILAIGATATSAVAAAAEKHGELVNKEKQALVRNAVTGKGTSELVWELTSGYKVGCARQTAEAKFTNTTSGTMSVAWEKCKKSTGGSCKTKGAKAEELRFSGLEVTVERAANKATDLLLVKIPAGHPLEYECAEVKEFIRGEYLTTLTPEEKLIRSFNTHEKGEKGVQTITKYVNQKGEESEVSPLEWKIGAEGYEQGALSGETQWTLEEEGEFI